MEKSKLKSNPYSLFLIFILLELSWEYSDEIEENIKRFINSIKKIYV